MINRYTAGQIGLFILGTISYSLLKPYLNFPLPEGKYWMGYGLLLIAPLILSFRSKPLFWCFVAYSAGWIGNRLFSTFDEHFLGHVPFLYLSIAGLAHMRHQKLIRNISGLIAIYCTLLILVHGDVRPILTYGEKLIYNMLYAIPLIIRIVAKKKETPSATEVEDSTYHHREAA